MSTFDETRVRRDGDGQFAAKAAAESDVSLDRQVETLQTDVPLERATKNLFDMPASSLLHQIDDDTIDLDPPCQRGDVWGTRRRRQLVKSMYEGLPIPPVMMNDRFTAHFRAEGMDQQGLWAKACIDGRQRLTTMSMFVHDELDELDVPASWFASDQVVEPAHETGDGPYVYYSDLATPMRRRFDHAPVGVAEFYLPSLEAEQQVFDRFNYGGVAQGDSDVS